ncbi:hypothetical protein [Rhodoferax saidenbachensis]|uniref:Membrane protein n=1 Tax=Rhodoferax saidenbachensis TaxID=1484693 RepID=A0ABU1ZJE5_9BURK|nr:hypothetical protein [Rhodoferax saidenbachensis]MDR7305670.1 putative membrane protein [Rhodoferax saidenbachensis]
MSQNFTTPNDAASLQKLQSLNTVGTISYVLHLIVAVSAFIPGGQFGVALLLAALILDMVKRDDAVGTWHASHFRWRIRSVLMAGLLYIVTTPLWLLLIIPGYIAWGLVSLWFLYRIISGFIAMNKGQEIGTP